MGASYGRANSFEMSIVKNILVFPAGTEIGLEIERSLRDIRHFNAIGATSIPDHSDYVYEHMAQPLPMFNAESFKQELVDLVQQNQIDYIFPAHDDLVALLPAWEESGVFPDTVEVIGSCGATSQLARSKRLTYEALSVAVSTPRLFNPKQVQEGDLPLFVKPDKGQGSRGASKVVRLADLDMIDDDHVLCELLTGEEYTVDCFTDRNGRLRYVSARARVRISNGISVSSRRVVHEEFHQFADAINSTISFRGMWFFQVKRNAQGELTLLEIAPRVSGGMGFCRARGVNLPALAIYDRMGLDVEIFENDIDVIRDCALSPAYEVKFHFTNIYVDLDDTLIFSDKTNGLLLGLLYHWRNQGKNIYLITRHRDVHGIDPVETLARHRIASDFFDNIIEVNRGEAKSNFIETSSAIFIDDSAVERFEVHRNRKIPTFTCTQACEMFIRGKGNF